MPARRRQRVQRAAPMAGSSPALKATSAAQASSAVPTAAVPAADGRNSGEPSWRVGIAAPCASLPPAAQYRCQRPRMTKMALVSVWPMVVMFACVPGAAVGSGPGRRLEDIPSSPAARRRRQHSGKRQVPDNDPDKRRADAATSPRRARAHCGFGICSDWFTDAGAPALAACAPSRLRYFCRSARLPENVAIMVAFWTVLSL